tara:strand:+ start:120 stop:611 length:492 start_codon:yes stop_codon:yes gene_type:complete
MTKLTIIREDKTIVVDGDVVTPCTHVDLSWIPTDVHAVQWDGEKGKGHVEYNVEEKFPQMLDEIGIWQQAVTDHANEKVLAAAAYEAARDHLVEVKDYRNAQLAWSDWTRLDDVTLSADKKTAWQTYRQALRDLPATIAADSNLTAKALADNHSHSAWPTKPS